MMKTILALPIRVGLVLLALCALAVGQELKTASANAALPGAAKPVAAADSAKPAADFKDRSPRYRIQAGDSFDVSFELSPEFNQTVSVQPDGFVTLRSVGDLKVAGETVPELTQTLRLAYSKILNAPLISVVLKEF